MMATKKMTMTPDTELKIAVCVSTYYKLNGVIPSYLELCSMLDEEERACAAEYMLSHGCIKARNISA